MVSTNSQIDLWQLSMLPTIRCAPDNFGFCSVQLEPVRLHPRGYIYVVDTCTYCLLEPSGCCWTAEAIYLRIVGVHEWPQVVTLNEPQLVRYVEQESWAPTGKGKGGGHLTPPLED